MNTEKYFLAERKRGSGQPSGTGLGFSVIPGIIYSVLLKNVLLTELSPTARIILTSAMVLLYVVLSQIPYLCLAVAVANAVIYIGLVWVVIGKIDESWLQTLLKVMTCAVIGLTEIGICSEVHGAFGRKAR